MPSNAFDDLEVALEEIAHLQNADPTPLGEVPDDPLVARSVGRASVVLLCSHFERYFYAVNDEAIDLLNSHRVAFAAIPESLRLLHTKPAVEALAGSSWEQDSRIVQLGEFVRTDAWLWGGEPIGALDAERLLMWMNAPTPRALLRYYRYWAIPDIFSTVATSPTHRSELWLRLSDLVDKRNAIAHGDTQAEATKIDVEAYVGAVEAFCAGADLALSDQLIDLFHVPAPW
jgi:RiboL-PSP-HEPN